MQQMLEPLWMEMDRPRETVRPAPYNRLQNPFAPAPNTRCRGPKMSVPDHRPGPVPAAFHMMFDGPTLASGHDPPDVASHAAPVLPLRSGSPVRPPPPGRR